MMKSEKGVTLISLTVTIIVLMILTGVGIISVYFGIKDFKDNALKSELGVVRQVVVEQYQKAKAVNKLKIENEEVNFFAGSKITDSSKLGFNPANEEFKYQEDYYYELTPDDLEKLGAKDAKYTYIVNYKTGEVYNETIKKYSTGKVLYLEPVNNEKTSTEDEDTESFNDW